MKHSPKFLFTIASATLALNATAFARPAPDFKLSGSDGKSYTLKSVLAGKPTLAVFFAAGCPHNEHGIFDMNALSALVGNHVRIVGFLNQSSKQAQALAKTYHSKFVILADPSGKTMNKFGATASLDNALVLPTGQLVKKWTGYDQGTLKQVIQAIRKAGDAKIKVDLGRFPADRQSGCAIGMDM